MKNPKTTQWGTKYWYNENGQLHRDGDQPAIEYGNGQKSWYKAGKRVDAYYTDFGCFQPKTREEAMERLNSKKRPYSRKLYLADINKAFPLKS